MPSYPESICVPGDSANAVTVGAIDKERHLAAFSAQGSMNTESPLFGKPNCVGPGVDIVAARSSTANFDSSEVVDKYHLRLSGTSMATPAVAGCLTLLKSKARSLGWETTPAELIDLFCTACRSLKDPGGRGYRSDIQVGHGLVDMAEAFRLAERRAPAHAAPQAIITPASTVPEVVPEMGSGNLQAPGQPGPVPIQAPARAQREIEPGTCYRCGKHYLSKIGVFSPAWVCRECGAPLCRVCWQLGHGECAAHRGTTTAAEAEPAVPAQAVTPASGDPIFLPARAGTSISSKGNQKEKPSMTTSESPSQHLAAPQTPRWGETFINRFDLKVRNAGRVVHPWSGEEFSVDPKLQAQSFRRVFGNVTQFPLASGLVKKGRLTLAAVLLEDSGLAADEANRRPADNILKQIAGADGLDFKDEAFYCVGIFSPVGWPEEWRSLAEVRGNAIFYLIEKGEGTCWIVSGPQGPLRNVFDPETAGEKLARAEKALADCSKLILPGDQVALDWFLDQHQQDRAAAEAAVQNSGGRFHIFEHKGKSYIQRSMQ